MILPRKDQTEAETGASGHGRVVKEKGQKEEEEETGEENEDEMLMSHYTIMSFHWKL